MDIRRIFDKIFDDSDEKCETFQKLSSSIVFKEELTAADDLKTLLHLNPETGEKIAEEPLESSVLWRDRKQHKNCKTQYFFLAAIPGVSKPVFFRVGGLGFSRARKFLNQCRYAKRQLFEFITKITVAPEESDYGKKYVLEFEATDTPFPKNWSIEKAAAVCKRFTEDSKIFFPAPQKQKV